MTPAQQTAGEVVSVATVLGYFAHALPPIATVLAIVWYVLLLIENKTMQALWKRLRDHPPPGIDDGPIC